MVRRVRTRLSACRSRRDARKSLLRSGPLRDAAAIALAVLALVGVLAALSGCGSGLRLHASEEASADVDEAAPGGCVTSVMHALASVATRVYREGISSERTASAMRMITASAPLRTAVEAGDAGGARAAARALIATGHLTNLRVIRAGHVLVDVGGRAVAPFGGTLADAAGKPIASFVTSVWADSGLIAEVNGIDEAQTALRSASSSRAERTIVGANLLPPGELPAQGTLTHDGTAYQFTSFSAIAYPNGEPVHGYVLRTPASTTALCGASDEATTFNTVSHIAHLIYEGEAGRRTLAQIRRVQRSRALLNAVARRDPAATRAAVAALLHHHIVRLRVSAGGRLLSDLGGPFVLAPVHASLRLGARTVGSFVLSIQDDEGYKRLANRLAGVDVLMYMGSRLVKSTLGPVPGPIPASGAVSYGGRSFRAYTFYAEAFPSGKLRITVLIPTPYS